MLCLVDTSCSDIEASQFVLWNASPALLRSTACMTVLESASFKLGAIELLRYCSTSHLESLDELGKLLL